MPDLETAGVGLWHGGVAGWPLPGPHFFAGRHNGGINALYFDGSVHYVQDSSWCVGWGPSIPEFVPDR